MPLHAQRESGRVFHREALHQAVFCISLDLEFIAQAVNGLGMQGIDCGALKARDPLQQSAIDKFDSKL